MNVHPAIALDETHDPAAKSWIESANRPGCEFPIQNLPIGVFSPRDACARAGVAIGNQIVDLNSLLDRGLLEGKAAEAAEAARGDNLNSLIRLSSDYSRALRRQIFAFLSSTNADKPNATDGLLHAASQCTMHLPSKIGNFTDFYAGIYHARAAGAQLQPDDPLPENYIWVPIAYHGRPSSVTLAGEVVKRPAGQVKRPGSKPQLMKSERMDFELELGFYVRGGNELGSPINLSEAHQQPFGFCLLNDWSARDIQSWEMKPLGPFLGKNFGTHVSPWIVTSEALQPFRIPAMPRSGELPEPLPYLDDTNDKLGGGIDIELEVLLTTAKMRQQGLPAHSILRSNAKHLYWTPAQMVAHHTISGCNLIPGDLIGTGTISGPELEMYSSLLELTIGGAKPFYLPSGERRTYLEDGDEVAFVGTCKKQGLRSIGFGQCASVVEGASEVLN